MANTAQDIRRVTFAAMSGFVAAQLEDFTVIPLSYSEPSLSYLTAAWEKGDYEIVQVKEVAEFNFG